MVLLVFPRGMAVVSCSEGLVSGSPLLVGGGSNSTL